MVLQTTVSLLVVCAFVFTSAQLPEGSLRINPTGSDPLQGTLEILFNGTWGTIAYISQSQANSVAQVVCRGLVDQYKAANNIIASTDYAATSGFVVNNYQKAIKPIWLSSLSCTGTEMNFAQCSNSVPAGLAASGHSNDLGVKCGFYCPLGLAGPTCSLPCLCPYYATSTLPQCNYLSQNCARCYSSYYGEYCTSFGSCSCNAAYGTCTPSSFVTTGCNSCLASRYSAGASNCLSICSCSNGGKCPPNEVNSAVNYCTCTNYSQFSGSTCASACNCPNGVCGVTVGSCYTCNPGFSGFDCNTPCNCTNGKCAFLASTSNAQCAICNEGYVGYDCNTPCNCTNGHCGRTTFSDPNICIACKTGWTGTDCNTPCNCPNGDCGVSPNDPAGCFTCRTGYTGSTCSLSCNCANGNCSSLANAPNPQACATCNPGYYGPNCLPCNCTSFGGVCSEGINGTGECNPDGWFRLASTSYPPSYTNTYWNGRVEIWKNGKWGTFCYNGSQSARMAYVACGKLYQQLGMSDWQNLLSVSTAYTYLNDYTAPSPPTFYNSFYCPQTANLTSDCLIGTAYNTPSPCYSTPYAFGVVCGSPYSFNCPSGMYGPSCNLTCLCKYGTCASTRDPITGGRCTGTCVNSSWTGPNCDIACLCAKGQCSGTPSCSSCNFNYYGPNCFPCNCTSGTYCNTGPGPNYGILGDGRCLSYATPPTIRLSPDPGFVSSGRVEAFFPNYWSTICYLGTFNSQTRSDDANIYCKQLFGPNSVSVTGVAPMNYVYTPTTIYSPTAYYISNCLATAGYSYASCINVYQVYYSCNYPIIINCTIPPNECGNNVLEAGEQCDGGQNCTNVCTCPTDTAPTPSGVTRYAGCVPIPVDCTWNSWRSWSACTAACGSVVRDRTQNVEKFGGRPCSGSFTDARACLYSECSVTCNGGMEKPLSDCATQLNANPSPCVNQPACAAFPSANCNPNPCDSCNTGYFVNGHPVNCTPREGGGTLVIPGGQPGAGGSGGTSDPPVQGVPVTPPPNSQGGARLVGASEGTSLFGSVVLFSSLLSVLLLITQF